MNNTLSRHNCYLVQTGKFKNEFKEITGISSIIDLNYMGSSEFECGTLPASMLRIMNNMEFYDVFTFPQYKNELEEMLKIYAPRIFIEHISNIVHSLVKNNIRLKEYCSLYEYFNSSNRYTKDDFWWDIENDFYIFFGEKEDLILKLLKVRKEKIIKKIKFEKTEKLAKYYYLNNPDLDDDIKDFLISKQNSFVKTLFKKYKNNYIKK